MRGARKFGLALGSGVVALAATVVVPATAHAAGTDTYPMPAALSCTSSTFCMAVGTHSHPGGGTQPWAARWTGQKWVTALPPTVPANAPTPQLVSVSCASPAQCEAVGYIAFGVTEPGGGVDRETEAVAYGWNGSSWTVQTVPDNAYTELLGVSCTKDGTCQAVGFSGQPGLSQPLALRLTRGTWEAETTARPTPVDNDNVSFTSVSCSTSSNCVAGGFNDNGGETAASLAETWNGATWSVTPVSGSGISSISCPSTSCLYLTSQFESSPASAGEINANPPAAISDVGPNALAVVFCSGIDACEAVGRTPVGFTLAADRWNGSHWVEQALIQPKKGGDLTAVSCPVTGWCMAVGAQAAAPDAIAETWTPSGWATAGHP
jgi:hypothetical protein